MRRQAAVALLIALGLGAMGCSREEAAPSAAEPEPAAKWTIKGTIVEVNAAEKLVTIDHQDIPGLMGAMTMGFRVEDVALLEGLEAGAAVEFELEQTSAGLTVTGIRKINPAELEGTSEPQVYHGEGTVVLVNRKAGAVLLKHDGAGAIPAGELVLPVVPVSLLEGLEDDTPVEFTLTIRSDQLVVSELRKREK